MDFLNTSSNSYPIYAEIYYKLVNPLIDLCGLACNIWIILVLIFGKVKISNTTKLYYLIIGVSDLVNVANNFIWNDICIGFWLLSNGKFRYCFDSLTDLTCMIMNLSFYLSEIVSDYSLVSLTIERLIAVCAPFMAKSILTKKFRFYLLFFLVGPFCILYSILIAFSSQRIPIDAIHYGMNDMACIINYNNMAGLIFNISMPIIVLTIHSIFDLFASFILFYKVYLSSKNSDLISKSKADSKDVTATLVLIMLCTITLVIFGTTLAIYIAAVIFEYFLSVPEDVSYHVSILSNIFLSALTIPHSTNFFVYLVFIPSFRYYALCKLLNFTRHPETKPSTSNQS